MNDEPCLREGEGQRRWSPHRDDVRPPIPLVDTLKGLPKSALVSPGGGFRFTKFPKRGISGMYALPDGKRL